MSFETIEKYLRELEALKYYDEVKRQRDKLVKENAELKDKVAELEKEIEGLKKELERLAGEGKVTEEKLRKKTSAARKLGIELGKVSNELKALKEIEIKSVDGRNLTLEEARDEFIRARESEIEGRANQKFGMLKVGLEAKMPKLIYDRLIQTIGKPPWPKEIAGAIGAKAKEIADGILRSKERWPSWFKEFYLKEVRAGISAGLNAEFARAVEGEATKRAEVKLRQLTRVEWPRWYEVNVKPKIEENVIVMMRAPWDLWCDKCGVQQKIELTEQDISDLLSIGHVRKECVNPHCKEWDGIRRHWIRISLRDLIAAHIGG